MPANIVQTPWYSRRNALKALLLIVLVAPYFAIASYFASSWADRPKLVLSSGSVGGLYSQTGEALVRILNESFQGKMSFEEDPSDGSSENVERIQKGTAQLALTQDGLAVGPKIRVLASLYSSPLQIVVRMNSGIDDLKDLGPGKDGSKRRAFIGQEKSGTRLVSELVLRQYGLSVSDLDMKGGNWNFEVAEQALTKGEIDVAFFLVGVGAPALNALGSDGHFKLLSIVRANGLTTLYPYLQRVEIPAGTYASPENAPFPNASAITVATREVLICSNDMSTKTAYKVVEAIFNGAPELVHSFPLLTQLSQVDPRSSFYYPVHPGAVLYYNREESPTGIPWRVLGGAGSYTLTIGTALLIRLHRRRARHLLARLNDIESRIRLADTVIPLADYREIHQSVLDVQREALLLYSTGKIKGDPYGSLKEYIGVCKEELERKEPPGWKLDGGPADRFDESKNGKPVATEPILQGVPRATVQDSPLREA